MVRLLCSTLLALAAISAHAETAEKAMNAAVADTASTAATLSSGLTELNPIGAAGTVVLKVVAMAYIGQLPEEDRAYPYSLASSVWGGAAANNLCWLTEAGPLCILLGIVTGRYLWNSGEERRSYWASCKVQRLGDRARTAGVRRRAKSRKLNRPWRKYPENSQDRAWANLKDAGKNRFGARACNETEIEKARSKRAFSGHVEANDGPDCAQLFSDS